MGTALDQLVDLLRLDAVGPDAFRGANPEASRPRTHGGLLAAQALVAAARTTDPGRPLHSLYATFLQPGVPGLPLRYDVVRLGDRRSFSTRQVVATQEGQACATVLASFHVGEEGPEHQLPVPQAVDPEGLPTFAERMGPYRDQLGDRYHAPRPLDVRRPDSPPTRGAGRAPHQQLWVRADGVLPDDALVHAGVLAYASDVGLLDCMLSPHGLRSFDREVTGVTLGHALWLHRPFRADRWLLYEQESPSAHGALGLARGCLYTLEGAHVASVTQESLLRLGERRE